MQPTLSLSHFRTRASWNRCCTVVLLTLLFSRLMDSNDIAQVQADEPVSVEPALIEQLPGLHLLEPAWSSPVVYRESGVLLVGADGVARLRLAFPAAEILEMRSADGSQQFSLGEGVSLDESRMNLVFEKSGTIEAIAEADRFLPKDSPMSYRHRVGDPETYLLYAPGRWFHDHNIEVSYRRADFESGDSQNSNDSNTSDSVSGKVRQADDRSAADLPRTLQLLRQGEPLRIAISGDSISTGLDASYKVNAEPNQTGYAELVAAQLQQTSGSPVTLVNRSVAGWSIANGVSDLDALLASKPDLLIVAYGMNDVGRRDPTWYREQTALLIENAKKQLPEIEIILVATMLGNDDWIHTPREMFPAYRDELKSLTGPGIALADLTEVWTVMLQHKDDLDLTGNGLNHPNDFGHRLYAQSILAGLVTK